MIEVRVMTDDELVGFYIDCVEGIYRDYMRHVETFGITDMGKELYKQRIEGVITVAMSDYRAKPELFERILYHASNRQQDISEEGGEE